MSDHYGVGHAIADVGNTLGEQIRRHNALPPQKKNLVRAGLGTGLIAFGIYALNDLRQHGGLNSGDPAPLVGWGALMAFGLLWFFVGVHGARGARDIMQAFWALVLAAIYGGLLGIDAYLPPDWALANFVLKGVYIGGVAGSFVRFWLSVRGPGIRARRLVERQIQQTGVTWRTGGGSTWRTGRQRQF